MNAYATKPDMDTDTMDNNAGDMPRETGGGDEGYEIRLDANNPDIAEAFADCKEGEMLKLVRKGDDEIVLQKVSGGDEGEGETEMDNHPEMDAAGKVDTNDNPKVSSNPAVMALIGKRVKH